MQTGRAIIVAGAIVAATGAVTAWLVQPRYSLANPGQGVTLRLDRSTGDMIGCERLLCRPVIANGEIAPEPIKLALPPLPPGAKLDKP